MRRDRQRERNTENLIEPREFSFSFSFSARCFLLAGSKRWMKCHRAAALRGNTLLPCQRRDLGVHANYAIDYPPRQCSDKHTRGSSYTAILIPNQRVEEGGGEERLRSQPLILGDSLQNRYFLHDYINKHTCTRGLLARSAQLPLPQVAPAAPVSEDFRA